ncbi:hypothetical protein HOY82DRAFT_595165 [Tuber indicum]|nr:hypothetical protein HOY82DRAFT_595165 [Tuber indicum]
MRAHWDPLSRGGWEVKNARCKELKNARCRKPEDLGWKAIAGDVGITTVDKKIGTINQNPRTVHANLLREIILTQALGREVFLMTAPNDNARLLRTDWKNLSYAQGVVEKIVEGLNTTWTYRGGG